MSRADPTSFVHGGIGPCAELPAFTSSLISSTETSKDKLWLEHDGVYWLFKYPRPATGEHWAERIAAGIAELLKLPCAEVHLAERHNVLGTISRRFVAGEETLVHGNELMAQYLEGYDAGQKFKQREHRIDLIMECVLRVAASGPRCDQDATLILSGYLVLDALIGNTDRHHENWGVIEDGAGKTRLAPTYDHASSLGRELSDEQREQRLRQRGPSHYLRNGRGAVYMIDGSRVPPYRVMEDLRKIGYADAVEFWVSRLRSVGIQKLQEPIEDIPDEHMSESARKFARSILEQSFEWLTDH